MEPKILHNFDETNDLELEPQEGGGMEVVEGGGSGGEGGGGGGERGWKKGKPGPRLPESTRQALCQAIMARQEPWYTTCDRLGVSKKTYYKYKVDITETIDTKLIARGPMKQKMQDHLDFLIGVSKKGLEMAQARTVEIKDRDGATVSTTEVPDLEAMSMFMKDLRATVQDMGDLHELTGRGAANRMTRTVAREKMLNDLQVKRIEAEGMVAGGNRQQLNVFVMPKAPGVATTPGAVVQQVSTASLPILEGDVEELKEAPVLAPSPIQRLLP